MCGVVCERLDCSIFVSTLNESLSYFSMEIAFQ